MSRRLTWLDVFSHAPLAGNQLAVVHDADGIPDAVQGAFAAETNLSETTFVQSATQDGADYRNRIWMPHLELPFAGHPSLGTAVAVALARGDDEATYVQQTQAGLQQLDVRRAGSAATPRCCRGRRCSATCPTPDACSPRSAWTRGWRSATSCPSSRSRPASTT